MHSGMTDSERSGDSSLRSKLRGIKPAVIEAAGSTRLPAAGRRNVCMTRICNSIQIRQPIEQVFDFITTPANWPQWHPASVSVGGSGDHSLHPGEAVTENISVAGHRGQVAWLARERSAPH